MPEKEHKMTILLPDTVKNHLIRLARNAGISQGAICRQLINHAATMLYGKIATCATGQPCLCPHLHVHQQPPPTAAAAAAANPDLYPHPIAKDNLKNSTL